MGGFNAGGPDRVLQQFIANPHGLIYSSPVYFDGKVLHSWRGRRAQGPSR